MRYARNNWTRLLSGLVIASSFLTGCALESSEPVVVCVPVVEYDQGLLDRADDELDSLPEDSAIEVMLTDYSVMRDQARACQR